MHPNICLIFDCIIRVFREHGLNKTSQKKIFEYIYENEEELEKEVKKNLSKLGENLEEACSGFLSIWIESIFLGMKGIY